MPSRLFHASSRLFYASTGRRGYLPGDSACASIADLFSFSIRLTSGREGRPAMRAISSGNSYQRRPHCTSRAASATTCRRAASEGVSRPDGAAGAILPGALDTPMTRRNLNDEQIKLLSGATKFGTLPQLEDVASLVCYLCSRENTGITGQFIASDLGYSHARIV